MTSLRGCCLALAVVALALPLSAAGQSTGASARLAKTRMTLRGSELPLGSVLNQIARSAQLALVADKDVRLDRTIGSPNLDDTPLDTALAVVLTPLGYSYDVDEKRNFLRVFVYETRTFKVGMPVVVQNWSASIANAGGVESGGGGSSGDTGMGARIGLSARTDTTGIWDEIERSMWRLLGGDPTSGAAATTNEKDKDRPREGVFSVNRVAGFVTVRALPAAMPSIESYFEALNSEMGRTVAIETKVLQVELTDTTTAGLDWNLLSARLGDLVFLSGGVQPSRFISPTTMPFLRISGRAGDSFIRAMEEQGKVEVLAQPTLALGNNLPAIIELAQVQSYVSQQKTTIVQGSSVAEITVQTSTLSDGLIISMLPRVLDDGEISLALATILQDVLEVKREDFGQGFVELPRTTRRSYSGVVRAKLNETMVIGGLISTRKERTHTGIPFLSRIPVVGWLFGGLHHVDKRSELIITVTPREIRGLAAAAPPKMEELGDTPGAK